MKNFIPASNNPIATFWYVSSLVLFCFPVLPLRTAASLLGLHLMISAISGFQNRFKRVRSQLIEFVILLLFPLFYAISYLLSEQNAEGLFELEKASSLLILPVVYICAPDGFDRKWINVLLRTLGISATLLALFGFFSILFHGWVGEFSKAHDFAFRIRADFEYWTHWHPTYVSVLFLGIVLFNIHQLIADAEKSNTGRIFMIAQTLVLFLATLLLGAKMPLIAFCISIVLLLSLKHYKYKWIWLAGSLVLIGALIFTIPGMSDRLAELRNEGPGERNTVTLRMDIWDCSLDIIDESWITGVGFGQVQTVLERCYNHRPNPDLKLHTYNSHNQYFSYIMRCGIFGLILFFFILFYALVLGFQLRDGMLIIMMTFFALCFLTENILERQHGIFLFTLLCYGLFLSSTDSSESSRSAH